MAKSRMRQPEPSSSIRCAIYTRKSTEEGLEKEFNSLDAQRESGENYIRSQQHEGWNCLPQRYDDGGFSGGNMERPALARLMADIEAGKIDCVVVYKVDRLSRSLLDFSRMMGTFDKHSVSFVSVTQQFNTTHSMGRLTLNILAAERMMSRVLSAKDDELPFVKVYRAGLTAGEREAIEAGLRDRSVRLVFSTSALELGIDIGALDVALCIGLPSSMMSLWQRAGRVARAGKEGAIILIPADTPIDSYYATHPDELFAKENEPLALNLNNRRVVYCHYACAVNEVGGVDSNQNQVAAGMPG